MPPLYRIKENVVDDVNPWKLFKTSEISLAIDLVRKISETLSKFTSIDLNSISGGEKTTLMTLSDNAVPYEWRKLWQGPKLASEFLKSVAARVQTVSKFAENLDAAVHEVDFSKIFNVGSFLSTVKLETSRELKISTSNLTLESFTDESRHERMKFDQAIIVTVAPLFIDGLSFEKNRLVRSDGFITNSLSSQIYLFYKEISTAHIEDDANTCTIPLYATHLREKLLCTIKLKTLLDKEEIVYSGTSLIVPVN